MREFELGAAAKGHLPREQLAPLMSADQRCGRGWTCHAAASAAGPAWPHSPLTHIRHQMPATEGFLQEVRQRPAKAISGTPPTKKKLQCSFWPLEN